jgi:RimJ/RimL family protein N-acetyltransferase
MSAFQNQSGVRLIPVNESHAENMFHWMDDPEIRRHLGLRREPTLEKTIDWIRNVTENPETTRGYAILSGNAHVGNVVLDRIDRFLSTARFFIYIGENRGTGLGRAATRAMVEEGFGPLGLHKIWLTVHRGNVRAISAYLDVGFKIEGVLRDEFLLDGNRVDVFYMGILKDDFLRASSSALPVFESV